jgi:hypothetical protein
MLVGAVASAAVTVVAVRHQVSALAERLRESLAAVDQRCKGLEESRDKLGERIGLVERQQAVNTAVARALRTPALGTRVLQPSDDSGEHKG